MRFVCFVLSFVLLTVDHDLCIADMCGNRARSVRFPVYGNCFLAFTVRTKDRSLWFSLEQPSSASLVLLRTGSSDAIFSSGAEQMILLSIPFTAFCAMNASFVSAGSTPSQVGFCAEQCVPTKESHCLWIVEGNASWWQHQS